MQVVTLQTKDFKGLKNDIYTFGDHNVISGCNGTGKSSIAEAIIFALFGRTRTGNSSTDCLIHEASESSSVAVEFDTGTVVLREQSRLYGTSIKINGEIATQQTLDSALPEFKTFISVFLIGYFSDLSDSDQRAMLLQFAPDLDYIKLFEDYTRKPAILKKHKIDFNNIDKEYKSYKKIETSLKDAVSQGSSKERYAEEQIQNLKKPKARIDVEETQKALDLIAEHEAYNKAIQTNKELSEQSDSALNGTCSSCGANLSEETIAERVRDIKSRKLEVPSKPHSKLPKTTASELREKLSDAKAINALYENYEEQVLDLEKQKSDAQDAVTKANDQLGTVSVIVEALSPKGIRATAARKQIAPIVETLNKYTGDSLSVQIETLEQLKTRSDMKEVFKVYGNAVPYKYLSTGERKRIDVALAQTINEFTDNAVNMFYLDDAELISSPLTISGQVFKAYVTSSDLTIEEG